MTPLRYESSYEYGVKMGCVVSFSILFGETATFPAHCFTFGALKMLDIYLFKQFVLKNFSFVNRKAASLYVSD